MTEYKSKMKRLWQISLAESFKVYVLAIAGWVVLFLLSQFLHSLGLDVLQGLLKLVYLILIVLLIFFALRPMAKTFFKAGFSPGRVKSYWRYHFERVSKIHGKRPGPGKKVPADLRG